MSGGKAWAKARDANEKEIVDALRAAGCKVHRLDGDPGVLDLLVEAPDLMLARMYISVANGAEYYGTNLLRDARDLLRSRRRRWYLMEVKNLDSDSRPTAKERITADEWDTDYAEIREGLPKPARSRLKKSQARFLMEHSAPMAVVTSVAEALSAVGLSQEEGS